MSDSSRPLVEPRAFSALTSEPLPLIDLVLEEQDTRNRTIRLVGRGIETAISYLQNALDDYPNILVAGSMDPVGALAHWDVVVFSSSSSERRPKADIELKLKGWGKDEVIEYVLGKSPSRCKSVMRRLDNANDLWLGGRSPRVLSAVLDQMIESEEVASIEDGIQRHFEAIGFRAKSRRKVVDLCVGNLFSNEKALLALYDSPHIVNEDVVKFLGVETVRYVVASSRLIEQLAKKRKPEMLTKKWPYQFHRFIAGKIQGDDEVQGFLNQLANSKNSKFAANAASLLVLMDPRWAPTLEEGLRFDNAKLSRVDWSGRSLKLASLVHADLSRSNLSKCNFALATMTGGNFSNACFSGANMMLAYAPRANFAGSNMRAICAPNAKFKNCNMSGVVFECSDLEKANFNESDLTDVDLSNCDLKRAQFLGAKLHNVNLSHANLVRAMLRGADLRTANIEGADFSVASLKAADLRTQNLNGISFCSAQFFGALLTGTVFRNCDLANAKLVNAKMAEIDWEDCDLQGADFTGCHFQMGSTRAGAFDSPYPSHGTRTGYYTDDYDDHYFKTPEEIRKASLYGCNLLNANVFDADFYLVDLRDATYDEKQKVHFQKCGAILTD